MTPADIAEAERARRNLWLALVIAGAITPFFAGWVTVEIQHAAVEAANQEK